MDPYTEGYRRACRRLLAAALLPGACRPELDNLWASDSRADRELSLEIATRWEIAL
jgi:hypothetical protein